MLPIYGATASAEDGLALAPWWCLPASYPDLLLLRKPLATKDGAAIQVCPSPRAGEGGTVGQPIVFGRNQPVMYRAGALESWMAGEFDWEPLVIVSLTGCRSVSPLKHQ